MKKIVLLPLLIFAVQICRAQVPSWLWAESSNSTGSYEWACGIAVDTTTSPVSVFAGGRCSGVDNLGGKTMSAAVGTNGTNPFMGRFDENGNALWLSVYDYTKGNGYDYAYGYCRDNKDNTYSDGVVNTSKSGFIQKYNNAGVVQWVDTPGFYNFNARGVTVDGAGCIYITGELTIGSLTLGATTLSYYGSGAAIVIAKLDATGNFLWARAVYGTGSNDGYNTGRGITIDHHANIYITGGYTGSPTFGSITAPPTIAGVSNIFVAEYDSSGNALNLLTGIGAGIVSNDCCSGRQIVIDSCDDIYLAGTYEYRAQFGDFVLNAQGDYDGYIAKCDMTKWNWAQDFGGTNTCSAGAITIDKNTDVYVGGYYSNGSANIEGTTITGGDLWIAKLDNGLGYVDWIQSAGSINGSNGINFMSGIAVDNKGYIYVDGGFNGDIPFGGTTITSNAGNNGTIFLAKLDTLNHISITPDPAPVYCAGRTYTLPYSVMGVFNSGNIFTAQLSDASGSFVNPVNIGSYISTAGGTITMTIPANTPYGTHYRIRILSTKPTIITTVPSSSCINRHVDTSYFYITIYPVPALVINGNTNVCPGDSTTLSTSSAQHYLWSNGDTTSSITVAPSSTTTYSVALTNGPCTWGDTVTVAIIPLPVITVSPSSPIICSGNGVSLSATGAVTYHWSPAEGLNAKTGDPVYAGPTIATTYTVTGTDSDGCTGKTTVAVEVGTSPTASFTTSTPYPCTPQQLQFISTSTGAENYFWRFGDGSTSSEQNPLYNYNDIGKYEVTLIVVSSTGCIDSVTTTVTISTSENFVLIPSAFTPGAGTNFSFYPIVLCTDYSDLDFRVYDRWGNMLFETNDANQGWNGTYNGKKQPMDVYAYYLKMSCGTCSVFKKGVVTLIR